MPARGRIGGFDSEKDPVEGDGSARREGHRGMDRGDARPCAAGGCERVDGECSAGVDDDLAWEPGWRLAI